MKYCIHCRYQKFLIEHFNLGFGKRDAWQGDGKSLCTGNGPCHQCSVHKKLNYYYFFLHKTKIELKGKHWEKHIKCELTWIQSAQKTYYCSNNSQPHTSLRPVLNI